ncbi:hypothetical protein DM806_03020 [Sphingobium lactosutens]|nr:hypothetical protein [Sphingobium lactosutens]
MSCFVILRPGRVVVIGRTTDETMNAIILRVIERAPQWLRHDLETKDACARARAEETLAAMISDALAGGYGVTKDIQG